MTTLAGAATLFALHHRYGHARHVDPECERILRENAGAVACRRNPMTDAILTVYDSKAAGLAYERESRWTTSCETHGTMVPSSSRKLAVESMKVPEWCGECQAILIVKGAL